MATRKMLETLRDAARDLLEPMRRNGRLTVPQAVVRGRIATRQVGERSIRWLVTNSNDEIQRSQLSLGFYELHELKQLASDVGRRQNVLDVGANIGNHAVYFVQFMGARNLVLAEPFAAARQHLLVNLALNAGEGTSIDLWAGALGADTGLGELIEPSAFNIGLTKVHATANGSVPIRTGDDLVGGRPIDLVKIDVEGGEIAVLKGLMRVLESHKPAIYLEVSSATRGRAQQLLGSVGYRIIRESVAYVGQSNLTLVAS